jgi:hypothetical protein
MTVLTKFKLVTAQRKRDNDPVKLRREKLCRKLAEQLAMAKAKKDGKGFIATKMKKVIDEETGLEKVIEVAKKVKEWYWLDNNKIQLQVMYGTKALALNAKGANTIEIASGDELINTLDVLIEAVNAGELDSALQSASVALKERFDK